jgi:hypothetical protein
MTTEGQKPSINSSQPHKTKQIKFINIGDSIYRIPKFGGKAVPGYSGFQMFLDVSTLEDENVTLPRDVEMWLPSVTASYPKRT